MDTNEDIVNKITKNSKRFEYVSWDDVEKSCLSVYAKMKKDGYKPDIILGLLKGGSIPSSIMVDLFGVSTGLVHLRVRSYDGMDQQKDVEVYPLEFEEFADLMDIKGKEILIVDDIWDTGKTMLTILEKLKGEKVTTMTLFAKINKTAPIALPDYFDKTVFEDWIVFPWEKYEFWRIINGE